MCRVSSADSSQMMARAGLKALGAKHHAVEYIDAGTKTRPFYGHRDYLDKVCGAMGLGKFAGMHGVSRRICCWHLGCILPSVPATIARTGRCLHKGDEAGARDGLDVPGALRSGLARGQVPQRLR